MGMYPPVSPFARAEEVRRNVLVFTGEHFARPSHANRHFVSDQKHVVLASQFPNRPQIAGWMNDHSGCSLDQRLDHHGSDVLVVFGEDRLQFGNRVIEQIGFTDTRRGAIGIGTGEPVRGEQERFEH